jgi:hypothetical protein
MGFKEVQDLDAEVTVAIGGLNRKTGKPNPTKAEGYYLGTKQTVSKKSRSGFAALHILQTPKGNLGVWGKTDLDRKMANVTPGTMIRVSANGKVSTPNGDMYKFKVEVDAENTIEVNLSENSAIGAEEESNPGFSEGASADETAEENYEETSLDAEEEAEQVDDIPPARATAPRQAAQTPDAARQAKVKALLAGSRTKTV